MRAKLFSLYDSLVRKLPSSVLRLIDLPSNYASNSVNAFAYESVRMINTAMTYCRNNQLQGDYAEFGVYQGSTTREAYAAASRYGLSDMKFHIFDSFEGLPSAEGIFHTGQFQCSQEQFVRNLGNVDLSRFNIVPGFYSDTLPTAQTSPISIAWIDCDLYDSTVPVLEFLKHHLVNGAVVIFDDWFCLDQKGGERRACKEWLEANPSLSLTPYRDFHWAGRSFIFTAQ